MKEWSRTRIAPGRTHHLLDRTPLYPARFDEVLSFHAPGCAAARDGSGAFHIDLAGLPAYARRFRRTFGFYEFRAAVEDAQGSFHIRVDGSDLTSARYAWCGNFQDGRCTVREANGHYFHITTEGDAAYGERYVYAGDYREGSAVVQEPSGLHLHIDRQGRPLNDQRFLDLDVFHKGYARARDADGWHHVDATGASLYSHRFAAVEPFYNGQARVEREDGSLAVIDERGDSLVELRPAPHTELQRLSGDMVGFWRTQALCAAAELGLIEALPASSSEVAKRRELDPDRCARLLRALGELKLVVRQGETWHPTQRGMLLHAGHPLSMKDAALHWGHDCYRSWETLPDAIRGRGTWEPPRFFEALALQPERVSSYHRAMATYARHDYSEIAKQLATSPGDVVLDAGGGTGTLLCEVLRHSPGLKGVLLERPEVAKQVEVPHDLRERLLALPVDLFSPWATQGDTILFTRVLHDWNDADALRLLHRAREALRPGGRLYVIERVCAPGHTEGALLDIHMLVTTGGRERTGADFDRLFAQAGFQLVTHRPLAGANMLLVGEPS